MPGKWATDRTILSAKDSPSRRRDSASQSWAATREPADCVLERRQARGEENSWLLPKTNGSKVSSAPRPRASPDERTPGILPAREDPQVPAPAWARLPLLHRRQCRKAKRDFLGQQSISRHGEMCVRHSRESRNALLPKIGRAHV